MSDVGQTHPDPEQSAHLGEDRKPAPDAAATRTVADRTAAAPAPDEVPAWLAAHPRYRVVGPLGAGGMGAVYRAEHQVMARPVALKVLNPGLLDNPATVERFRREAQAAARLAHPNIVTAYDAEQEGDHHFLVMEYVEGVSLARLGAEKGPLPVQQACEYVRQAALGLQHAHERGMVHRDIKPHNLMLTPDGVVKVLDFGLARFALESTSVGPVPPPEPAGTPGPRPEAAAWLTQDGLVMGTPDFIAPEQATNAHTADIRADIYSLGCTLYYLLAGQVPFPDQTVVDKLLAHASRPPRPLAEVRRDVPAGLVRVVERMTAKDPAKRYQTPAEVAAALAPFARTGGPARRWRWVAVGAGLLVAAGLLAYLLGPAAVRLTLNRGQLAIDTEEPAAEVLVLQGGRPVHALDLRSERSTDLPAGEYQLRFTGDRPDLRLTPDTVVLTRTGRQIAQVRPVPGFAGEVLRCAGHTGRVFAVAFTPDGRRALSAGGGGDNTVRVWDLATGREIGQFRGHTDGVRNLVVLPDGSHAVSASWDHTLRLWDIGTGAEVRRFEGHTEKASGLAAWGPYLLSGGMDGTVRLWEIATGKEVRRFEGHPGGVHAVAFSPDGRYALSGDSYRERGGVQDLTSADCSVRLWEVATGREVRRFTGHKSFIHSVAFSPDGRRALSGSLDLCACLWDVSTGEELRRFPGHTLCFSSDGRRALADYADGSLRLVDLDSGREFGGLAGHTGEVLSVAVSADGRHALSGSGDRTVRLWRLPEPGPATQAVAGGEDQALRCFRGHWATVKAVALSPDGRRALSGSGYLQGGDNSVRLWDVETGKEVRRLEGHDGYVQSVAFSPDGRRALSGGADHTMRLWDLETGRELRRFNTPGQAWVNAVAFCPDGRHALSGGDGEMATLIRLWDLETGAELRTYPGHQGYICTVAVSPDGRRALSGAGRGEATVRLWDVATGRELRCLRGHKDYVESVAFSPDSRRALSAGSDGTIRLWDLDTGQEVRQLLGHAWKVHGIAFAADGSRAVSCGSDGTVRLWDVDTGHELRCLRGHTDMVWGVAITGDGRRALSGGADRTLRLWDLTAP
jgi:WD40 repeat protein